MEIVTLLGYPNRDTETDPSASDFVPQRWTIDAAAAQDRYPNLFLSGPRVCAGREMILFVIKAALGAQLAQGVVAVSPALAQDPLPVSFPLRTVRFGDG
jgi:cytochrome P450